jgi:hypothetical protein
MSSPFPDGDFGHLKQESRWAAPRNGESERHAEILDRPVEKLTFVFGLPRTGTTLTINLLNEDPARRCFLRWEAFASVPPPQPEEFYGGRVTMMPRLS